MAQTRLALMAALIVAVGGCTQQGIGTKQGVGALGGAAVGGLLGSQIGHGSGKLAATGAGVLLGALLGSEIGASLDRADQAALQQNTYTALSPQTPIGQEIRWNNPNNGNSVAVTPVRDGYSGGGAYCREYQQTIIVGGQTQTAYGQACQQPDGSWKVVN